jgi:Type IV secretory system Conjugative DNA transfer
MTLSRYRSTAGTSISVSPVRQSVGGAYECDTSVPGTDMGPILAAAAAATGWPETRIVNAVQQFTATRSMRLRHGIGSRNHELSVRWVTRNATTTIAWMVHDTASSFRRVPDEDAMRRFGDALIDALRQYARVVAARPPVPHDPMIGPRQRWMGGQYTGDLYDYSRLALPEELYDLSGLFCLGTYAFPGLPSPSLYVPEVPDERSREKLRHRGILLCAPTRAGKTSLILRWAETAIANGFSNVIVDPKGNLLRRLRDRLAQKGISADIYYCTTDPRSERSDTINFLDGLNWATSATDANYKSSNKILRDRLRQIVAALLPRFEKAKGEGSFRRDLHRDWALAILQILKLAEFHFPDDFTTNVAEGSQKEIRRSVDLGDLYSLAANEDLLIDYIGALREREQEIEDSGGRLEVDSVEEHVTTLAGALDPAKLPDGKRAGKESYESYMQPLRLALAPFSKSGFLFDQVVSSPERRNFSFDMLGRKDRPVTLVLAAREQDEEPAEAILRLAITRLRHMVLDRIETEEYRPKERPGELMLFLDETVRIEAFNPAKYFEIAAEAGVTTVVVYQSLDRVGNEKTLKSVMRNVGMQVYLGNVRGSDEQILNRFLGQRETERFSHGESRSDTGRTQSESFQREGASFFPPPALHRFPMGRYPALVVMNDERHAPFIVDMFDPTLA